MKQDTLSPPYEHQLKLGQLHGVRIAADAAGIPMLAEVYASGPAARAGVPVGTRIRRLNRKNVVTVDDARAILAAAPYTLDIQTPAGKRYQWAATGFPQRSLPVQPTQIYSSINALLLFLSLWLFYPFRWKNGQVIFGTLGLYAVSRFVLEMIRTDESGYLGTYFTISQWVSLIAIVAIAVLGFAVHRQPLGEVHTQLKMNGHPGHPAC